MTIDVKRAYDPPAKGDGYRVLVDRVWPRGIAREELRIDDWQKDLAPSTDLRKWFGHDPKKWEEFRERYTRELEQRSEALDELGEKARDGRVTLVFGAKDTQHNNAVALKEHLERRLQLNRRVRPCTAGTRSDAGVGSSGSSCSRAGSRSRRPSGAGCSP